MSDGTGHFSDLFCDVKWRRVEIQAEFRMKIAHPVRRQQLWQAPIWGTHTSLDVRISQIQFPSDFNPRAIHISKADMLDGFVAWIIYKRQRSHLSYVHTIPLLSINLEKKTKTLSHKDICIPIFIEVLFTMTKIQKQLKGLSILSICKWIK